jgi:hypothetical protein
VLGRPTLGLSPQPAPRGRWCTGTSRTPRAGVLGGVTAGAAVLS